MSEAVVFDTMACRSRQIQARESGTEEHHVNDNAQTKPGIRNAASARTEVDGWSQRGDCCP